MNREIEEMTSDICSGCFRKETYECEPIKGCVAWSYAERAYNKGYRKKDEWIGVEDRLPDAKDRVLVYIEANHLNEVAIDTDRVVDGRWVRWGTLVTHWMPLPEEPKKKYESEGKE